MTSPDKPLAKALRIGTIIKQRHTGEIFRVKCNCSSTKPRNHTLRYVTNNIDDFVYPTTQEVIDGPIL